MLLFRFVLILVVFWDLAGQQKPPQLDRELQLAVELHRANDLEGARREYQLYLNKKPGSIEARSNLGAVLARLGRYDEAIAEYKIALEKVPNNPGVRFNYGLALYKAGRFDEATREFAAVHSLAPDNKQIALLLGDCYLRSGENQRVIDLLDPFFKANDKDTALAYLLGTALIRANQVNRGQEIVNRILSDGESAEARLLLGTTKMMAHDFAGALTDIAKAAELNPLLPSVNAYHGLALLQTGDSTNAMIAFRKELQSNPNDFDSNLNVGALLRQEHSYDEARKYFEKALRLRPGHAAVRYQLATIDLGYRRS